MDIPVLEKNKIRYLRSEVYVRIQNIQKTN